MHKIINQKLANLADKPNFGTIINSKLIGIEKESLRVLHNGELSHSNHPKALGSALTNTKITTDYAESQLELITKPSHDAKDTLQELFEIHSFIYANIGHTQLLWPSSIPGKLPNPKDIVTAKFGKSNLAKFKELYRSGLGYRYGKTMQLICGIHYNFSFSKDFWPSYFSNILDKPNWDQKDINVQYMNIVRNYMRISWLVSYLFGASPAINANLIHKDIAIANYLKLFKNNTYVAKFGTSLRNSNSLGYHNKHYVDLMINYNSVEDYANSLLTAISTEDKEFVKIGKYRHDKIIQINCNILQLENEYYGKIRPKPDKNINEMPLHKALKQHGIAYIELRNIDLNPYSPIGLEYEQCLFLELLVYYCLFVESPEFTLKERAHIKSNTDKVALLGRQPGLLLSYNEQNITLTEWASTILSQLLIIAGYFDKTNKTNTYTEIVHKFQRYIDNPELLPSSKVYEEIINQNVEYTDLFLDKAKTYNQFFANNPITTDKMALYENVAHESLNKLKELEEIDKTQHIDIEQFIAQYYNVD